MKNNIYVKNTGNSMEIKFYCPRCKEWFWSQSGICGCKHFSVVESTHMYYLEEENSGYAVYDKLKYFEI
jgi:hypothetical protein